MAKKAKSKSKGRTDKGKKLESAENTKKSKFLINDIFKTLKTTSHTNTSKASTKPSTKSIVKEKSKVKGLPFDVKESDIKSLFSGFNLPLVEFITKRGKPIGCAYVYLSKETEAREAKNKVDGKCIKNKKVQVTLDFLKIDSRIQPVYKPISVDRFRQPSRFQ
nr:hypothetical protein MACL_00000482 [Theileria orientalis]